ncbi:MAG: HAD-IA family hydrolase [Treponemataceae bacterium]
MVKHLLFDLDNTLYPASPAIDDGITQRMLQFIAKFKSISVDEAKKLRSSNLQRFGTTLEWLIAEQGFPPSRVDDYFAAINPENEIADYTFDPNLRDFLLSLNLPMTILTNAPMEHALRILSFLNIDGLFLGIHDIRSNNFKGKPHAQSYLRAITASGFSVEQTIFFDDHIKYINGYAKIGGVGVLIDSKKSHPEVASLRIQSVYEIPHLLENIKKIK